MRGRALLLAAGPLLLGLACILAAFTTRTWSLELAENEPVYLPQLDAALTVFDYRVDYHPGTAAPRDYSCRLAIATESDTVRLRASVNRPARYRGHKFYLVGTRAYQDPFRFRVVLALRRFPAWPLVLAGIIATTLAAAGLTLLALRRGPREPESPRGARGLRLAAVPLVIAGAALVAIRAASAGRLPFANMYEALLFWSFCTTLFLLLPRAASLPGLALAAGLLAVALLLPGRLVAIRPLAPALASPWFTPHIAAAFLGYGGLTAATFAPRRNPALPLAFIAFTLAIGLGMVWAEQAWANFWSWDPKETWALVTWLLMALALVLRLAGRERVERVVTALAFATVLYNYVVVNLVLRGLHSYR
ncbi:cytochrome c biogenesis protein CcsA [candidate division WOR-3 bacterium]|nr:cytochrome c biogenesis protein CcsA [candidate division WOR-3 bacterium]